MWNSSAHIFARCQKSWYFHPHILSLAWYLTPHIAFKKKYRRNRRIHMRAWEIEDWDESHVNEEKCLHWNILYVRLCFNWWALLFSHEWIFYVNVELLRKIWFEREREKKMSHHSTYEHLSMVIMSPVVTLLQCL